jgi:hypothetical protein
MSRMKTAGGGGGGGGGGGVDCPAMARAGTPVKTTVIRQLHKMAAARRDMGTSIIYSR